MNKTFRACLKSARGAVFPGKAVWSGWTREDILSGSQIGEQQRQTAFSAKTRRAAVLLPLGFVGLFLTAHCGDAQNNPPRPKPKSPAEAPLGIFRQSLSKYKYLFLIQRGAMMFLVLASWLLHAEHNGGSSGDTTPTGIRIVKVEIPPVLLNENGRALQPLSLLLHHDGQELSATASLDGVVIAQFQITNGLQSIDLKLESKSQPRKIELSVAVSGNNVAWTNILVDPPTVRDMWILPHSHVDIGYTHRQEEVREIQISNLQSAMRLARASAGNPPGLRFKWNPEAVWSVDNFFSSATPEKRLEFIEAVRRGDVEVDALYANTLTGLCRPEELAQCLGFGLRLSDRTGVPLETAMICDVPGYTWGIVPMLSQAGVKYFAIGPNYGDRVGMIHRWDNQPFYWKSQSGLERILCWVVDNYHHNGSLEDNVLQHLIHLRGDHFQYDSSFIFWVGTWPGGGVDNAPPDADLVNKAIAWNKKYALPKIHIGLAREFFHDFENRQRSRLPEFSGDLTPYWEDGAGSTSRETALNRGSGERLVQAATLFAMRDGRDCSTEKFNEAWRNILLYSEHTWGAYCSISKPDDSFTKDQWDAKRHYAVQADIDSREILKSSLPKGGDDEEIDVYNTTQWERRDIAWVPSDMIGESVVDDRGHPMASQRMASGQLVFLAEHVPAFGARRFRLGKKTSSPRHTAKALGLTLQTSTLKLQLDAVSGAIRSLTLKGTDHEYVDCKAPVLLNDYRYVLGTNSAGARSNGPVQITVLENGPLVASFQVDSDAPGCNHLTREVRLLEGLDRVELVDKVDRKAVRSKDGVHFGFGFNVPGGTVRMETPWAIVRPNVDQLPGSCRNWFTVQRWVDISNRKCGITWAPMDAPLMEIGGMTANLLGSVKVDQWMTNANDSQTIYSWAQNNHWHTNYKMDQPGITEFRYFLRPHQGDYSAATSAQFGVESSRPLIAVRAGSSPLLKPLLSISTSDVLVETLKPSNDGNALILRLSGISDTPKNLLLKWISVHPESVWCTDLTEKPLAQAGKVIAVPAHGVVEVRAELP